MEPASTGLQELIDDLKSIITWIFTPEKVSDSTNEDFVLFPRELLADIGQHADESDRTTQGQILIFLYLLICEPVSKAFKFTKPQFPHLQTGSLTSTGLL